MSLSDWLNLANSIAQAATALLTLYFALQVRDQNEAANRPVITVYPELRRDHIAIDLVIKNVGRSPAENVTINLDRSFQKQFGGQATDLRDVPVFKEGMVSMATTQELRFLLGPHYILGEEASPQKPLRFNIHVQYSWGRKHYSEKIAIDLTPFTGGVQPRTVEVDLMREQSSALKSLGKWADSQFTSELRRSALDSLKEERLHPVLKHRARKRPSTA